jgi:hypothetical protein
VEHGGKDPISLRGGSAASRSARESARLLEIKPDRKHQRLPLDLPPTVGTTHPRAGSDRAVVFCFKAVIREQGGHRSPATAHLKSRQFSSDDVGVADRAQ